MDIQSTDKQYKQKMTQSVFEAVISWYKTILENQHEWNNTSFPKPQDNLVWNS